MNLIRDRTTPLPAGRSTRRGLDAGRLVALLSALERRLSARLWVSVLLVTAVTGALRMINLSRSFDVYYDELVYLRISQDVAQTMHLTFDGTTPVYLHPPLFFILEAAVLKVFSPAGNVVHQIYAVRYLNATLASLSAVALFLLGRRAVNWRAGVVTAAIFALDPFITRINSRNLLQTSAIFFVLVGYCFMLYSVDRPFSWRRALGVGVAFGAALLSNEPVAFLTLLPLGVCFLLNWSIPRLSALLSGVLACLVYAVYPLMSALDGEWAAFQDQKLTGIYRLIGLERTTGFGRPHGPSFSAAISLDLSQFGTTYALIGLGAVAVCFLLAQRGPAVRLVGIWGASAYLLQGYSIKFGTNEEQYFYYLIVLAIPANVMAAALIVRSPWLKRPSHLWAHGVAAFLLFAILAWSSRAWAVTHSTPDNGYERLSSYLEQHVPPHSRIAAATLTSVVLLRYYYDYMSGFWQTPEQVQSHHAQYVVISPGLIAKGYEGTPALRDWLAHHARLLFAFVGPSSGLLDLYRIPPERPVPGDVRSGASIPTSMTAFILFSQTALTFGRQRSHTTSAAQTIHIVNLGPGRLAIGRVAIGGRDRTAFAVRESCTGQTIGIDRSCTLAVSFHPTAGGEYQAYVTIDDNTHVGSYTIPLAGRA